MKKLLDSYSVFSDGVPSTINIWLDELEPVPAYELLMPELGQATTVVLNALSEELSEKVPLDIEEEIDPLRRETAKRAFLLEIKKTVALKIPTMAGKTEILSGILLHKMYGLGTLELILADNWLEEVAINGSRQPVSVYHKKFGWCKTNQYYQKDEDIYDVSSQIGRKVGREINTLNPIMDAHLMVGDRAAATLFPISTGGNTLTIRRFARNPWTPTQLIDPKVNTMSKDVAALIWQATQYELIS